MKRKLTAWLAVVLATLVGRAALANDELIAKQIMDRLQQQRQTANLDGCNIGVQVDNGTVTMTGSVNQPDHAMTALDVARRVPGVKLVVNDLYVQPASNSPAVSLTSGAETIKSAAYSAPAPLDARTQPSTAMPQISGATAGFVAPPAAPSMAAGRPSNLGPAAATSAPLAFARSNMGPTQRASFQTAPEYGHASPAQYAPQGGGCPMPMNAGAMGGGAVAQAAYDNPQMPGYAWPSYAAYPNYAAVTYPHQYSPTAWPYIGPFYPYPQVPLGWRKVTLEWDDGWWFLDFKAKK